MEIRFFEAIMLICFGLSWPVSIIKSLTSRSNAGKSVVFLFAVFIGYIAGIINKILYSPDLVLLLYILNLLMVGLDIVLYFRNRAYQKQWGRQGSSGFETE